MNTGDELLLTAICPLQVAQHRSDQLQKQLARRGTDRSDQLQKQLAQRGADLLPIYDEMITAQQDLAAVQGIHHTSMKASSCFPLYSPGLSQLTSTLAAVLHQCACDLIVTPSASQATLTYSQSKCSSSSDCPLSILLPNRALMCC